MADLLGADAALADIHTLYALPRPAAGAQGGAVRVIWSSAGAICSTPRFDVLLYDLTSTYFESDPPLPRRRQAPLRLQPRQAARLRAGGDRPGGDARRAFRWPTRCWRATRRDKTHAARVPGAHRTPVRQGAAHLGDGSGHSDRGGAGADAREPIRRCSYLVGTPKGRLTRLEQALLGKPWQQARPGRAGQAAAAGRRTLRVRRRARIASPRNASMRRRQLKWLWARLEAAARHAASRAMQLLMKLGGAQHQGPRRLAPGRRRSRPNTSAELHLPAQPQQAAAGAPTRRPLSAAHQPDRDRSGQAVELLPAAGAGRGGLQEPQGRSGDPADLPPGRAAHRSAHLHRLPGLLPARHPRPSAQCRSPPDSPRAACWRSSPPCR